MAQNQLHHKNPGKTAGVFVLVNRKCKRAFAF